MFDCHDFRTYEMVEGRRKGSKLLWVYEEKNLYGFKEERSGRKEYFCYQNKIDPNGVRCSARRMIDANGIITAGVVPHSIHSNHESIYKDLKSRSDVINACSAAASALEDLHVTVPNQQIFTRELAK